MNWEAFGAIGEMLGAILVIVSLIYLALELRQSNQIARFTAARELMTRFNEINSILLKDQSLREILAKKEKLTDDEEEKLYVFADFIMDVWISVQEARNNELIKEEVYLGMTKDVEIVLSRWPKIRHPIELWLSRYPEAIHYQVFDTVLKSKNETNDT